MAEANYAEAVAQQDVISEALGKSFAARTVCKQNDILQQEKPLPWLRILIFWIFISWILIFWNTHTQFDYPHPFCI